MNYTNYIGTLRGNLCHILTELRNNEKKIKKIRENVQNIETMQLVVWPLSVKMVEAELNIEIEFYETLNDVYNTEINRLIAIILENSTEI